MLLLQLSNLTKYDQIPIVLGIFIAVTILIVYDKYLKGNKLQITGVQALDITEIMIEKVMKFPLDGHSIEKRASKLHHDATQALQQNDNVTSVLVELSDGQKEFIKMVSKAYEQQAKRDDDHHKDTMKMQEEHNKQLIDLLFRHGRNKVN